MIIDTTYLLFPRSAALAALAFPRATSLSSIFAIIPDARYKTFELRSHEAIGVFMSLCPFWKRTPFPSFRGADPSSLAEFIFEHLI